MNVLRLFGQLERRLRNEPQTTGAATKKIEVHRVT
jgi:hypothetical protein